MRWTSQTLTFLVLPLAVGAQEPLPVHVRHVPRDAQGQRLSFPRAQTAMVRPTVSETSTAHKTTQQFARIHFAGRSEGCTEGYLKAQWAYEYPDRLIGDAMVERILIVDDSKVARTVMAGFIKNRLPAASVLEAEDGPSALEMVRDQTIDLAILDIHMEWISGLQVAAQIRRSKPSVQLVVLSANVQEEMANEAAAMGIPFFRKPATGDVVDQILKLLPSQAG